MKCKMKGCKGEIDLTRKMPVIFIRGGAGNAYLCNNFNCGRMHYQDGEPVYSCMEQPVFFRFNRIVLGVKPREQCLN